MTVTVKLFAILKDRAQISQTRLDLPPKTTTSAAADSLAELYPTIKPYLPRIAYAVNEEYVPATFELQDGDELALIPPVSGGTDDDWLNLLTTDLNIAQATAFVTTPQAGGINIFLGTTRAQTNPAGHPLLALHYESYETMARKQLQHLAATARKTWPIQRLAILHRLGQVPLGQPSVLIAVSTPHRAESFEACRWIIDQLKKEVTIWKKEIWSGDEPTWVSQNSGTCY